MDAQQRLDFLKATWMAGDFGRIAVSYAEGAAEFIDRLGLARNIEVLDVACGTGNLAIPAARAGCRVTGIDFAPNLLEQARVRAGAEGLEIRFDEGDVEQLPYPSESFDAVVSMFGVMFAPQPAVAAREMARVSRRGAQLALASWTPEGFAGQLLRFGAQFVPPLPDVPSPVRWGSEEGCGAYLSEAGFENVRFTKRMMKLSYPDLRPEEAVNHMSRYFGPIVRTLASLNASSAERYLEDMIRLFEQYNESSDGTVVQSEYLETIAMAP